MQALPGTGAGGPPRHVEVLIVGSGFAGLGAAIRLDRAGHPDFLVIERGSGVGGTWRDNTYPGAACDIPSHLYSFSFAPNSDWSRSYSRQPEILDYLRRTAARSGTLDRHRFDTELLSARWEADGRRWIVETSTGTFTATVLVTAFGALCEPKLPAIDGIERFAGEIFHSARWNPDSELTGKRVAVIGTGASAIQLIPEIAPLVSHLDVYQRTAPWVMPRPDHRFSPAQRVALRHVPGYQRLRRGLIYGRLEVTSLAFACAPRILDLISGQAAAHLRSQIADPALRQQLTPRFQMGCKRILFSDDYYPALSRDNVELVTSPIAGLTENAIVTADGAARHIDTLIVATGFHVTDSPTADLITGADGHTLRQCWRQSGQRAYKGSTVAGFPNLFMLVGPNTGTGNMSMIYMIESQLNYLLDALRLMERLQLATVEVRQPDQDRYTATLRRRMRRTVYSSGCSSWYRDELGENTALWPGFAFAFRSITRRFDLDAYRITTVAEPAEAAAPTESAAGTTRLIGMPPGSTGGAPAG